MGVLSSFVLASALSVAAVSATLDPVVIKGSKFFLKTSGAQFYIKGVAYQQDVGSAGTTTSNATFVDPLANSANCARDVPLLKGAGTNVIRTYAIDPTADHSACMALLDAAGIYVISDLSEPSTSINRDSPSWDTDLYARYTSVVDALANYTNVIGFFAGNEVSNSVTTTNATAFVKAAVRDTKAYIKSKGYRPMGVGYAADDDATVRGPISNYLNCGDQSSAIDFWGYNIYEWCGLSDYITSGYNVRTAEFANYSVPAFFAEYGCNTPVGGAAVRPFTEVAALFGKNMSDVFSGGIVFEYFEETNDFGLVSISGNSASTLADYNALKTQISSITATGTPMASYTPTATAARSCPTVDANWQSVNSPLPPSPNAALCDCMVASLSCTTKSSVTATDYGPLFGEVCGTEAACVGIATFPANGTYGAYSMCSAGQQLNFVLDAYYKLSGMKSTACDFSGKAQIVTPQTASSACAALLAQAGTAGTGTVTSSPSGAASTGSASTSKAAAPGGVVFGGNPFSQSGMLVGIYILGAMATGVGMLVL